MSAAQPLRPFEFERRDPGPHDVVIDISHCGVCHSDLHQARDEWGGGVFPMVPGHEIVGTVTATGDGVSAFAKGDAAGVGVFVDSCRTCEACRAGYEQYCQKQVSVTYNGYEQDGTTPTYGGYSDRIVVDERYVLRVPPALPRDAAAPLLCAGITTWSPIRHFGVRAGDRAAVAGLGGLGHLAVKFLAALGADVTVLSRSAAKASDAQRLGAAGFAVIDGEPTFRENARRFDFIIDCIAAAHDIGGYLSLLRRDGTMVLVGLPPEPFAVKASTLTNQRRRLSGSVIGGIGETQEMLDFCAERGIVADIECIALPQINDAYARLARADVRYRFVIDMALQAGA